MKGEIAVALRPGGRVEVLSASTDIGQGTRTIFPQIVSEALGIDVAQVTCAEPDTAHVPNSGPTVASRTAMVVGKICMDAARTIGETLCDFVAEQQGLDPAEVRLENGAFTVGDASVDFAEVGDDYLQERGALQVHKIYAHPEGIHFDDQQYVGDAYPCYGWGADVAEVLVDTDTGEVTVLRFFTACDVGKALHPVLCEGQVEGGTLQGIGYALMEEVVMRDGVMANNRLTNYIIPTSLDAPEILVDLVEVPYFHGPFGAKGVGELPLDGAAPAVVTAVEQALGLPAGTFDELPVTPERVLSALRRKGGAEAA
jgi:CO/xanthine dehydrogenase Mo-binding subunit